MVRGTSRGDDIGKIFVGGLANETTKDTLQEYFGKFGEVTDCIVMVDNVTKRSRGFGFVTFCEPQAVDNVCQLKEHNLDGKKIDPKRAVPRGPGQAAQLSQGGGAPPTNNRDPGNENKVFVGGLASNISENDVQMFFSQFGKVTHVKLMYDRENSRMRGFGFVTFDSSPTVEEVCRIHYHEINGKTVEVKKAEQREARPSGPNMGMGGQMNSGGYGRGQYGMGGGGQFNAGPLSGMVRGLGGYGQMAPGYTGAPPMVGAGYGYAGMGSSGMPGGYGQQMYSQGAATAAAGYPSQYSVPTSAASMPPTSSGYPDYSQMTASQAGMPAAAPGAPSHLDNAASTDYSAYGLGNYQQQESSYGPARTSFSETGYSSYSPADQAAYGGAAAATYGGESFGRGSSVSRGFHPYGR